MLLMLRLVLVPQTMRHNSSSKAHQALPGAHHNNKAVPASHQTCPCLRMLVGAAPTVPHLATFPLTRHLRDGTLLRGPALALTVISGTTATSFTPLARPSSRLVPTVLLARLVRVVLQAVRHSLLSNLSRLSRLSSLSSLSSRSSQRRGLRLKSPRVPPRLLLSWSPSRSASPLQPPERRRRVRAQLPYRRQHPLQTRRTPPEYLPSSRFRPLW